MSFLPVKRDSASLIPWEYLPAKAGTYQVGQILALDGGMLSPLDAASTERPRYVGMLDGTVAEGETLPAAWVNLSDVYETTLSADASGAAPGSLLEISAGGLEADAAAQGAFMLVELEGTASGDRVRGRFV